MSPLLKTIGYKSAIAFFVLCVIASVMSVKLFHVNKENFNSRDALEKIAKDPKFAEYFGASLDNFANLDTDKDGIPDVIDDDIDNDGILNAQDNDDDNDGVVDSKDPSTAVTKIAGNSGLMGSSDFPSDGSKSIVVPQKGDKGEKGATGSSGNSGSSGSNGNNGTSGSDGQDGVQGPQGVQGPAGANGAQGATGPQGAQGIQGATGAQGAQGIQGATGAPGQQGPAGTVGVVTDDGVIDTTLTGSDLNIQLLLATGSGLEKLAGGLSLISTCSNNEVLKWSGSAWQCGVDDDGITYSAGTGITVSSGVISSVLGTSINTAEIEDGSILFADMNINGCTSNEMIQIVGGVWSCGGYSAGSGLSLTGSSLALDPASLSAISSVASSDVLIVNDGTGNKKITYNDLFGNVLGSLNYRGTWDADTNSPNLTSVCNSANKGYYYVVDEAGTTTLDGINSWAVNDWVICNGTNWQQIQSTNTVASVFGRSGTVTAQSGDYTGTLITVTPSGNLSSTNVQTSLTELDSEKLDKTLGSGLVFVGNGSSQATGVALSGDATISNTGVLTIGNDKITTAKILDGTILFADLAQNGCVQDDAVVFDGSDWSCGQAASPLTVGTVDSEAKSANGAVIANDALVLQTADTTFPGMVSIGTQSFAGNKTFEGLSTFGTSSTTASPINIIRNGDGQFLNFNNGTASSGFYSGVGSPEGVVTANVGSTYSATDTGSMYTKSSGTGNTGWTVLAQGVAASYMQATMNNDQNITANNQKLNFTVNQVSNGQDIQVSNGQFTLKAGKTYRLQGTVKTGNGTNISDFQWYDNGLSTYIGSVGSTVSANNTSDTAGGGIVNAVFTPSVDTVVELRYKIGNGSKPTIDSNGTNVFIQVIGGNAPVVGQTVDYLSVQRTGSEQSGVQSGTDLIFNTKNSGNIAFNTTAGVASLSAGKTYRITVSTSWLNFSNTTGGYVQFSVVDAISNNAISTAAEGTPVTQTGSTASSPIIDFIYTPSSNQTIKTRSLNSNGTANMRQSPYSGMTITQLGTSASTSIAMSVLSDAISTNALDNRDFAQTWNWSSANTQTGLAMTGNALTSGELLDMTTTSTGFTGQLLNLTSSGNAITSTGSLAKLDIVGSSNAAKGLQIVNAGTGDALNIVSTGSGLALNVSGAIATKKGTDYSTTGTQNNVNFGNTSLVRLTGVSAQTITGIAGGVDGKQLTIINAGSTPATISNESASSTVTNRVITGTGSDLTLGADATISLVYDSGASRWRVVGGTGSGGSTGSVLAEFGEQIITGTPSTSTSSYTDVANGAFTLPSAGTWEVHYDLSTSCTAAGNLTLFRLTTSAGVVVPNSSASRHCGTVNNSDGVSQTARITTTGSAGYKLQFSVTSGSAVLSGNSVNTITFKKIGGYAPIVGQTVDYITVTRTSNVSVANNAAIVFDAVNSGNIAYNTSTGNFTLSAGKTYELTANISASGSNVGITNTWYNVTAGANVPGTVGQGITQDNSATWGITQSSAIFTPSVDTLVQLRNVHGGTRSILGGTGNNQSSGATIKQIGSTASTGIAMSSLTDALASNALDNSNYSQTWNWSTLSTGTGMSQNYDALTSGKGLEVVSSSITSTNGKLVSFDQSNAASTGNTLTIGTAGSGLSLLVERGALAFKSLAYTATGTTSAAALGNSSYVRVTSTGTPTIQGITGGVDGKLYILTNSGTPLTLSNQNGSALAGNRIITGTSTDLTISADGTATLIYDGTALKWRVVSVMNTPVTPQAQKASGNVAAGVAVQLDNIQARLSTSDPRSMEVAAVSSTFSMSGTSQNLFPATSPGATGSTITMTGFSRINVNLTTSWQKWQSSADFDFHGSTQTLVFTDQTTYTSYRITLIVGNGFDNNMISIERLN